MNRKAATVTSLRARAHNLLAAARETLAESTDARHVRHARYLIALARGVWSTVTARIADGSAALRHTYVRSGNRWRAAVVAADDCALWTSTRLYAHRQSAQRAALAYRDVFIRRCELALLGGPVSASIY